MSLSGPMFQPSSDKYRQSVSNKDGAHYNIFRSRSPELALEMLREWFPSGANELNFVLFSTSGIHGSYRTLEEVAFGVEKYGDEYEAEDWPDDYFGNDLTFVLVQPRIVSMTYGNVRVRKQDISFLKMLRDTSWRAVAKIGSAEVSP